MLKFHNSQCRLLIKPDNFLSVNLIYKCSCNQIKNIGVMPENYQTKCRSIIVKLKCRSLLQKFRSASNCGTWRRWRFPSSFGHTSNRGADDPAVVGHPSASYKRPTMDWWMPAAGVTADTAPTSVVFDIVCVPTFITRTSPFVWWPLRKPAASNEQSGSIQHRRTDASWLCRQCRRWTVDYAGCRRFGRCCADDRCGVVGVDFVPIFVIPDGPPSC